MNEYVTIQGDTWDGIAWKLYQDESYMIQLMEHNQDHLGTVIFPAGIRLKVPEVQSQTFVDLPPWK